MSLAHANGAVYGFEEAIRAVEALIATENSEHLQCECGNIKADPSYDMCEECAREMLID